MTTITAHTIGETFCIHCLKDFPIEQLLCIDEARDEQDQPVPVYACEGCDPLSFKQKRERLQREFDALPTLLERGKQEWTSVDAFFARGFMECEDIWYHFGRQKIKAVYLCDRDGQAGIAIKGVTRADDYIPREVEYTRISARLSTPRWDEQEV